MRTKALNVPPPQGWLSPNQLKPGDTLDIWSYWSRNWLYGRAVLMVIHADEMPDGVAVAHHMLRNVRDSKPTRKSKFFRVIAGYRDGSGRPYAWGQYEFYTARKDRAK